MTIVLFLLILVLAVTNVITVVKYTKVRGLVTNQAPALEALPEQIPFTSKKHKLVRTFTDRRLSNRINTGQDFHGWHYECSCGTVAPSTDNFGGDGSEQGAVKAFINHRALYATSVEAGDNELVKLRKEFEQYKKECICHDL